MIKIPGFKYNYQSDEFTGRAIPPPQWPGHKEDPDDPAPKWSWFREIWNLPIDTEEHRGPKPWTEVGTRPESDEDPDWRGVIRKNVIEYKMPEPYKLGRALDEAYMWFDTPDYADPFKKLWWSFKTSSWFGYMIQLGMMGFSGSSYTWTINKKYLASFTIPFVAASMTGATAVMIAANLRGKKDDLYNYTCGALAFSSVAGRKNYVMFLRWLAVSTPFLLFSKYNAETNGCLLPIVNPRLQSYTAGGLDAKHGIQSGDFRLGMVRPRSEPGRDVRTFTQG